MKEDICLTPIEEKFISFLSSNPGSLNKNIRLHVDLSRRETNVILYSMQKKGLVKRSIKNPPKWSCVTSGPPKTNSCQKAEDKIYVLVDLGNVHDIPFIDIDSGYSHVELTGYSDYSYGGPKPEKTKRAKTQSRNAADVMLLHDLYELWYKSPKSTFVVCSKDSIFDYISTFSSSKGINTAVVGSWADLKEWVD